MTSTDSRTAIVAIRPAIADDAAALARLAALDSSAVPAGDLLLGVVDGCPLAAVSVTTGATIADPFSPTAELVALVRQRASRLGAAGTMPHRSTRLRLPARLHLHGARHHGSVA